MGAAVVDVLFNLIPRSSNADVRLLATPSWRSAANIKPKLLIFVCRWTQDSTISYLRHFGDRCTYQQADNQQFLVMSAFSAEKTNPEISFCRVFICASFWEIHYFVVLHSRGLFSWFVSGLLDMGPTVFPAGSSLSLFDWQVHNAHHKNDVVHRAGCQNPSSIRLCPEPSWILPDICGDISQRAPARGDSAPGDSTEEPGKAKETLEEISLQASPALGGWNNRN